MAQYNMFYFCAYTYLCRTLPQIPVVCVCVCVCAGNRYKRDRLTYGFDRRSTSFHFWIFHLTTGDRGIARNAYRTDQSNVNHSQFNSRQVC